MLIIHVPHMLGSLSPPLEPSATLSQSQSDCKCGQAPCLPTGISAVLCGYSSPATEFCSALKHRARRQVLHVATTCVSDLSRRAGTGLRTSNSDPFTSLCTVRPAFNLSRECTAFESVPSVLVTRLSYLIPSPFSVRNIPLLFRGAAIRSTPGSRELFLASVRQSLACKRGEKGRGDISGVSEIETDRPVQQRCATNSSTAARYSTSPESRSLADSFVLLYYWRADSTAAQILEPLFCATQPLCPCPAAMPQRRGPCPIANRSTAALLRKAHASVCLENEGWPAHCLDSSLSVHPVHRARRKVGKSFSFSDCGEPVKRHLSRHACRCMVHGAGRGAHANGFPSSRPADLPAALIAPARMHTSSLICFSCPFSPCISITCAQLEGRSDRYHLPPQREVVASHSSDATGRAPSPTASVRGTPMCPEPAVTDVNAACWSAVAFPHRRQTVSHPLFPSSLISSTHLSTTLLSTLLKLSDPLFGITPSTFTSQNEVLRRSHRCFACRRCLRRSYLLQGLVRYCQRQRNGNANSASWSGNDNGNGNKGYGNGNGNGNLNYWGTNLGNDNGNGNKGALNGNANGNLNSGYNAGNENGNGNKGVGNGNGNGNANTGGSLNSWYDGTTGSGNGNGNKGYGNGNINGNGNTASFSGNDNGNGNTGALNGNLNGNGNTGVGMRQRQRQRQPLSRSSPRPGALLNTVCDVLSLASNSISFSPFSLWLDSSVTLDSDSCQEPARHQEQSLTRAGAPLAPWKMELNTDVSLKLFTLKSVRIVNPEVAARKVRGALQRPTSPGPFEQVSWPCSIHCGHSGDPQTIDLVSVGSVWPDSNYFEIRGALKTPSPGNLDWRPVSISGSRPDGASSELWTRSPAINARLRGAINSEWLKSTSRRQEAHPSQNALSDHRQASSAG
ncbi:hypothetical protein L1887_50178 [Cichorium endivia]|nr:hypothetical protein L1887_50178 [Cichorium endivia]